ncbi:hypothetical protein A0U91_15285 (plasmid) [Acetobacter persici]|uniref:site-specific DNA-methyltransferase (cytosine-N(4)-specific) n=2 Tax=Acetobacter persici TaxID=1076596 RepID=A0A1U9LIV8_9PROT|nr:hypothetical protein A0U91_15285 [Acetobacter persici]
MIVAPRLSPPSMAQIKERLSFFKWGSWSRRMGRWERKNPVEYGDLSPFFHKDTLADVLMLRDMLCDCDPHSVDGWIRMVVMAILTGHSPGFLSRYSLPPGNTASPEAQRSINAKYDKMFERKDVSALIEAKSARFLAGGGVADLTGSRLFVRSADDLSIVSGNSVQLVMTSPPFVDVIDYAKENWMRMWFGGVAKTYSHAMQAQSRFPQIWNSSSMAGWEDLMNASMREMLRILKPGGFAAIEVGEIRKGSEPLDERVTRLAKEVGFLPVSVFINSQKFTKAAHIWGVNNQVKGTNTNRIVLLRKPGGPLFDYAGTFSDLSL